MKASYLQLSIDFYQCYERLLNHCQSAFLLLIRLTWGILFAMTGWGKWHNLGQVTDFFTGLGIPFPALNAYIVATTELVGGIFLILGLLSRLTPVPLIVAMVVAYATSEHEALQSLVMGDPDPFLSETPFLFLFASLLIFVFGPGKFSLDHLIAKRFPPSVESKASQTL